MSTPQNNSKLNPLSKPFVPSPTPPTTPATPVVQPRTNFQNKKDAKQSVLPRLLSDREYRELLEQEETELEERKVRDANAVTMKYAAAVERWAAFDDEEDFMPQGLPEK
ncbi:uncharacterized protein H6S33_009502 [Morchella sextelata]|uniref:uncharacterized protein n=1 Tax=Morchella sextelata TaxID=1174677 RepID=UPI001D03B981|nr:uncharacterized protein H6S33_009502 [Morchella sextelata]KAH0613122.1 hypothetical protein H6S33_009502 [Morchella sextelata]